MKHPIFTPTIILVATFAGASIIGYQLMTDDFSTNPPVEQTANLIEPYHFSFFESYALCEEYNLGCKPTVLNIEPTAELAMLSLDDIRTLYPSPQWLVIADESEVSITHLLDGLCAEHKKTLHLGVNQSGEYITICYGPSEISSQGGVYLISDVKLSNLTTQEQDKILHGYYESTNYEELQGILDSFSEY